MNNFIEQLISFPTCVAQKFITDPCIDKLHSYNNTFDVDIRCTYDGSTVLMMICKYSHTFNPLKYTYYIPHAVEKIKWLLTVGGANPNIQDEYGWTALMYAARYSSPHGLSRRQCIAKTLKGYNVHPTKQRINKNMSFMIVASIRKDITYINPKSSEAVVRILLTAGANPDIQDEDGWTALMLATCNSLPERGQSSEKTVKMLLTLCRANPDIQDYGGWTALMYAAWNSFNGFSSERTVELILSAKANPHLMSNSRQCATDVAGSESVKKMIQKYIDDKKWKIPRLINNGKSYEYVCHICDEHKDVMLITYRHTSCIECIEKILETKKYPDI